MGTSRLRIDVEPPQPGSANMARDTGALEAVAGGGPGSVRIYGFAPACLSLGRLQPESDVNWDACRRDGVDVVRRPTGGRAVLHDAEVTYAVACRVDDPAFGGDVLTACAAIHAVVAAALNRLGVVTRAAASERPSRNAIADCFAKPAAHELLDSAGTKLVGSAQARRGRGLLQHGSVLLAPPQAWRYLSCARPPLRPQTLGLRGLLARDVGFDEVAGALAAAFGAALAQSGDTKGRSSAQAGVA